MQGKQACFLMSRRSMIIALLALFWLGSANQPFTQAAATGGATFNITWSASCQTPPAQAITALEYAAGLWGTWISSTVPIEVTACWTPNLSGGDTLGTGMPSRYISNFSGAPLINAQYPIALANALSGSDLDTTRADMRLQFKSDAEWSYITTTTRLAAPTESYDFVGVALHELAHGLGFIGNMYEDYNIGFCGNGPIGYLYPCPTPYDWLTVDSAGVPLLDYLASDPSALGARLKSDANLGGPNTVAANGGTAAKLYTPSTYFYLGSSLSHLDQNTFSSGPNRLMTPSYGGVTRQPGPVTLAIMQDMGWLRADGAPNVVTSGPLVVGAGQVATFTGKLVWSAYAGQPLTYTWTAADQITVTHPGLAATDSVTFTWSTPGEKRIALAATDDSASAAAVRAALVYGVNAGGPAQGDTNHAYTFNANVTPSTGFPITYTWEATDKTPIVHTNSYLTNDNATFSWTTPGTKTITITAAIAGAATRAVHTIHIKGIVLDKFVFLPVVLRQ